MTGWQGLGVTDVVMESTGAYWKPVYYILENDFRAILVNAAHVKHGPGRKTDTIENYWIIDPTTAEVLESGVPPRNYGMIPGEDAVPRVLICADEAPLIARSMSAK